MKKIVLCLCLALTYQGVSGQFERCDSPTARDLHDVWFIDRDMGVAVGDSGTIVRSTDGGIHWNTIMSDDTIQFRKIKFFDAQHGIVIGSDIFVTDDAGASWTARETRNDYFFDVEILNDSTCIVSGTPNRVLKSTDKGMTWETLIGEDLSLNIQFLSFVSEDIGYANKNDGGVISSTLKTADGGRSWTEIADGSGMHITLIEDIVFISEDVGFRGGWYSPHLMRTDDSSNFWEHVDTTSEYAYALYDFHIEPAFPNAYFACGWYGDIFKSTDGGRNWRELNTGVANTTSLYGIFFIDDAVGWVVGAHGTILKTTNGGGTISSVQEDDQIHLKIFPNPSNEILYIEKTDGLIIEKILVYGNNGRLVRLEEPTEAIDLSNLATGMYHVVVRTNKGTYVERVVKH